MHKLEKKSKDELVDIIINDVLQEGDEIVWDLARQHLELQSKKDLLSTYFPDVED